MAWRLVFPVDEIVEVLATHVEQETGNFFVQISDSNSSKLDDLMEDIANYVAHNSASSLRAKTLKVGDICLAQYHVDEVWYRGKVLGVDNNGYMKVFFIDYGNCDLVASNNAMLATDKFVALPPQAYECELANVKPVGGRWGTELLVKFEELILEQTFVAKAVSLKTNNVLVLSLFQDATMGKLAVDPLISAGYLERTENPVSGGISGRPNQSYSHLELDNFSFEDVLVTYCENPSNFYCILLKNSTALHKLMEELGNTYREATEDDYPLKSCCQDNPCCAKYSADDMWYRAIITSETPSSSGEITVKFVDYGNSETVHISNLMGLDERFLELPMQALECALYGVTPTGNSVEWPQDACDLFETLANEKQLVSYLSNIRDNAGEVFLFDTSEETKDINFGQVLVDQGKAVAVKPLTDYKKARTSQRRKSSFGIIDLVPNSVEKVVITNIESPSDFYCQLLKHSNDLTRLMDDISEYYEALSDVDDTITLPQAGMLCCGRYTEDNGWYRALILSSDIANRQVEVLYVDYGNFEMLPIARIKELKPQFVTLPQQAIPCCLYGVSPSAPSWTDQAIEAFENAILDKELQIKVVSHSEGQHYGVCVTETVGAEEYSINKQLVQKGFAMSDEDHPGVSVETNFQNYQSPAVEIGNYVDIEVTHVENLDQFWCHLVSSADEMGSLMTNLQEYYDMHPPKGTDVNVFSKGGPCCARFSEDNLWYRGKILEKMSNNRFKVRFVDYGNCEVVSSKSVAVLNPEFLQLPVQAIECSLASLPTSHMRTKKFVDKFLDLVNGKELVGRMDERGDNGRYSVLLIDTGSGATLNINEEMVAFSTATGDEKQNNVKEPVARNASSSKVDEPDIAVGSEEPVYITCVNSSEDFHCQLARTSSQLDSLMNNIEAFYRDLSPDDCTFVSPRIGDVCCAMFTVDDGFYRAVVTNVSSDGVGVRYLDYGNGEELPLSRIWTLNAYFTELPAQCFHAKSLSTSLGTTAEFEEKVLEKELKAEIVRKDKNDVYVVRLSEADGRPLFPSASASAKRTPCKVKEASVTINETVHVYVTSVTNSDDFFCQFTKTSAQLDDLMNEIEEHYRPLGEQQGSYEDAQIGEACCAMFTLDDGWYRARVTKHSGTTLDVCYIDYGNSETIPKIRVKTLHENFTKLPVQGFHACVKTPKAVNSSTFKDSVLEKEFEARIVAQNTNSVFEVELFTADGTKLFGSPDDKKKTEVFKVEEAQITKGAKEHVYVTFFESPEKFFCQLMKTSKHLDELMDQLEEFYRPLGDGDERLVKPKIGDTCCAMFTEDDGWYRAIITKVSVNTVEVKYIDYGNSEELPVSRVKRLLACYCETSVQGFSASLVEATSDGAEKIREAIDGKELMVRVTGRKSNGDYDVEAYDMNGGRLLSSAQESGKPSGARSINDFLSSYSIVSGAQMDVCGSHCESPNMFYLHLVKNKEILEKVMTELSEVYCDLGAKDNAIANPAVGMFCVAKFPVDGGWYRARILSIPSPNEVEVCYVDFGNCERVGLHDIKTLAPAFHDTPVQAVKCRLHDGKEKWNGNECETFEILVLEKHLIADVKSIDTSNQTLTVNLFDTHGSENINILTAISAKSSRSQEKLPKVTSLPKLQLKDVENVLVESAENLDSFVCQFTRLNHDLDTVADMMYETYHEGTPPDFVTAPLQVDDVIAAMFSEDQTWYRASVSGLNPDGGVHMTYIDYGNSETIPRGEIGKRVRYLEKELLRYPPMRGVTCSLSRVSTEGKRYSWTPRAHDAFVRYVVEKEFRARLSSDKEPYQALLEDHLGSIHTWLAREKLVTSKDSEPEVVQDDYYELKVAVGTSCDVYVTHSLNPEEFYVQQAANADAIDKVMDDIHTSCTDGSRGAIVDIKQGTLCAAQYTADDAWYRARVTQEPGPDSVEVLFVDYGNTEVLPKERIKELDSSLLELPAQAIFCGLQIDKPTAWDSETKERFETTAADKCLKMTVVKDLDVKLLVTITDEEGSLSLNDMFSQKSSDNSVKDSAKPAEISLSPYPVSGKQTAEVYISHLASPGEFYVQLSGTEDDLERLAEQCAQTYDSAESEDYKLPNPRQDMFCCARYSEDEAWYRAQILSIDSTNKTATVRFVDHGNTDVANLASDLRRLSVELSTSPCQAIPCSLARGSWTPEQSSKFETAALDKPLQATFEEYFENTWIVTLKDETTSLNQLLLESRAITTSCVQKPRLAIGDEPAVYIVSVHSPDDVTLQLSDHVSDLETLMHDIANDPPQDKLPITQVETGASCLALFTEDEAWYRAKVLDSDGDLVRVLYVDYGNAEWLDSDRLAPISERFSKLPEVSLHCCLDLSNAGGDWTDGIGERLVEIYGEHELRCKITSENDEVFSVKLFCDGEDVLAKLLTSGEAVSTSDGGTTAEEPISDRYRVKKLTAGERKEVICSHIETPQKLWCQLSDDQAILDDLMDRLHEVYSALGVEELLVTSYDVGSVCCGQFLDDNGWYRAEILGKQDEGVMVRYVDYGNEELLPTTRLRILKPEFLATPRQAIECLLADIQSSDEEWSPDAIALVEEFTAEKSLTIEIKSVDDLPVTAVVYGHSEDEEVSLGDLLVEKSFATRSEISTSEAPENSEADVIFTNFPTKIGDKLNLFYVSADSPANMWCQLSDFENDLLELMEQLGAFYGNLNEVDWSLVKPVVGAAVCAQFTEDDSWYRAEILETGTSITVRFVDYGNCEELTRSRVKILKPEFAALPKQAIHLALAGVSPESLEEWSEEQKETMDEMCSEKCYVGEILGISDGAMEISLREIESQGLLLDELCQAGLVAKESGDGVVQEEPQTSQALEDQPEVETPAVEESPGSDLTVEQPIDNQLVDEMPVDDRLLAEVPVDDQPVDEVPVDDQPVDEVPVADQLVGEVPADDEPVSEIPADDRLLDEVPVDDQPVVEVPVDDQPMGKVPVADQLGGEIPADDQPVGEIPVDDKPVGEVPFDHQPVGEVPADDQPVGEVPADDQRVDEVPVDDQPGLKGPDAEDKLTDEQAAEDRPDLESSDVENQPVEPTGTPALEEKPTNDQLALDEPVSDERPPIKEQADDELLAQNDEAETMARGASPSDSEEDLNDATTVCHAIDRLLDEIDSRSAEVKMEDGKPGEKDECDEETLPITAAEEKAPCNDEKTTDFEEDSEKEPRADEEKVSPDFPEDTVADITPSEISAPNIELQRNQLALESDSVTNSSSTTPSFLSPRTELTDESPSDETNSYMTPPDELVSETINEDQALFSSPESDTSDRQRYAYPEINLGDIHKVFISHIQSPSSFFCQMSRMEFELSHLMETIQTTLTEDTEEAVTIDATAVGSLCCAQSPDDGKWYRAVVRNIGDDDHVDVTLVDFGKTISLPVGRLRAISHELVTSLPRQAVHCALVDLEPADEKWSADAVTKMTEVCDGKVLEGIFRSRHRKVYNIYLRDPENDDADFVNKLLVDLKLARVTGRDSDSGEGAESSENNGVNQESIPGEKNDEKQSSGSQIDDLQSETSRMKISGSVEEFLENLIEAAISQAVKSAMELSVETEDVSGGQSEIKKASSTEIPGDVAPALGRIEETHDKNVMLDTDETTTVGDRGDESAVHDDNVDGVEVEMERFALVEENETQGALEKELQECYLDEAEDSLRVNCGEFDENLEESPDFIEQRASSSFKTDGGDGTSAFMDDQGADTNEDQEGSQMMLEEHVGKPEAAGEAFLENNQDSSEQQDVRAVDTASDVAAGGREEIAGDDEESTKITSEEPSEMAGVVHEIFARDVSDPGERLDDRRDNIGATAVLYDESEEASCEDEKSAKVTLDEKPAETDEVSVQDSRDVLGMGNHEDCDSEEKEVKGDQVEAVSKEGESCISENVECYEKHSGSRSVIHRDTQQPCGIEEQPSTSEVKETKVIELAEEEENDGKIESCPSRESEALGNTENTNPCILPANGKIGASEAQNGGVNGQSLIQTELEASNTQTVPSAFEEEACNNPEEDAERQTIDGNHDRDSFKQPAAAIAETQEENDSSSESNVNAQCLGTVGNSDDLEQRNGSSVNGVPDMGDMDGKAPLEEDCPSNSPEKVVLDALMSEIALRDESVSSKDDDLDID